MCTLNLEVLIHHVPITYIQKGSKNSLRIWTTIKIEKLHLSTSEHNTS